MANPALNWLEKLSITQAISVLAASFAQPAALANVTIVVDTTEWMNVSQCVFVQGGGYYTVSSITDLTHAVITNLGLPGNAAAAATIAADGLVMPAGEPGFLTAPIVTATGGGDGTSGGARPDLVSERDCLQTTNATLTTFKTYAVPTDLKMFRLTVEMFANRTDVDGDAAYFMRDIVVKRSGSSLTTVSADADLKGPNFVGTSSTWTLTLVPSAANILVKVQGASGKTIKWSMMKESFQGTT